MKKPKSLKRVLWLGLYRYQGIQPPYPSYIDAQAALEAQSMARQFGYGYGPLFLRPSWRLVRDSLVRMNGRDLNEMELAINGRGSLVVVGGDRERYGVSFLWPDTSTRTDSLTLTDPDLAGPDVEITVQITPMKVPSRYAVGQPLLLATLEHFHRTGELPKGGHWEIGNTGQPAEVPTVEGG